MKRISFQSIQTMTRLLIRFLGFAWYKLKKKKKKFRLVYIYKTMFSCFRNSCLLNLNF